MVMEGDPFMLIEGMAIAARRREHGLCVIRSEYPYAIAKMESYQGCPRI
jgi:formate dehydrogenase iron-sulfur subunit